MNINDLKTRVSVRTYTDRKLTKQETEDLIEIINNSPTSTNAQQFSALLITDQADKDFISKGNWGQKHIAEAAGILVFLGDTKRNEFLRGTGFPTNNMAIHEHSRAMVDATIAVTYAQLGLMEMGFDSAHVGGIAGFGKAFEERFNLPNNVFPVVGLAFGEAAEKNEFKPKMNKVFIGKYNKEQAQEEITNYNKTMTDYYKTRGVERSFKSQLQGELAGYMAEGFEKNGAYYRTTIKRMEK